MYSEVEKRTKSLRQAARAAVYQTLKKRHQSQRRWLIAIESLSMAIVIALVAVLQVYFEINPPKYTLDATVKNIVGESRGDTKEYLKEDMESKAFTFEVPKAEDSADKIHTGRVADVYSATLPKDAKKGVSVTDTESQISVNITPKFKTYQGKKVEGDHIVYLAHGGVKLVYTLKYTGPKEDIIVPHYMGDELDFDFNLSLPTGVEAEMDQQGNIAVYSAEPTLFGHISFGSEEDRRKIEAAREKSEKNNLLMTIPRPIIKDANGNEYNDRASYSLGKKQKTQDKQEPLQDVMMSNSTHNSYELSIASKNLKDLDYPISIDPTMQLTSASDFSDVTLENGAEIDSTNSLIRRSGLSGGVVNDNTAGWSVATASITNGRWAHATVAHNGYLYAIGGLRSDGVGGVFNSIQIGSINSSGDVTSWTTASATLPAPRTHIMATVSNGYLYVIGGAGSDGACSSSTCNSVYYSKINTSDGTLGTFATTTNLPAYISTGASVALRGYLYVSGGVTGGVGGIDEVFYAQINADGSLGTWTTISNSLPAVRYGHAMVTYNDYVYVLHGESPSGSRPTSVYYNRVNSDGTLASTSWISTSSFTTGSDGGGATILDGYMYLAGGCTSRDASGDCLAGTGRTQYAQINADGTLGIWRNTTQYISGYTYNFGGMVASNGRLYTVGGCYDTDGDFHCDTGVTSGSVNYVDIKAPGELHGYSTTNTISTARIGHATVAYNGYIYVIGGCTALGGTSGSSTNCTTATNTVEYGTIDSSTGAITWSGTTATIPAARWGINATAYNGRLYVSGGCEVGFLGACSRQGSTFWTTINTTGTLAGWSTDADAATARTYYGLASYNGYLYIVGGDTANNTPSTSVQKTQIQSDGSVGAWSNETALPFAASDHQIAAYDGYLYAYANHKLYNIVINSDATLGSQWNEQLDGSASTNNAQVIIDRGYLYVAHPTASKLVDYGRILDNGDVVGADGSTSTLTATSPSVNLTNPHDWSVSTVIYGGIMYVVAGCTSSTGDDCHSSTNTVELTPVINGGNGVATGAFTVNSTNFTTGKYDLDSVVYNGYVYVAGGKSLSSCVIGCTHAWNANIRKAPINDDGSIGSWVDTSQNVPGTGGATRLQMVAVNGFMYIIGGENSSSTIVDGVYRSAISSSDGSLGVWSAMSNFPTTISEHQASVFGNNIIVTGGRANGSSVGRTEVYKASVDANGNLSSWTATTSMPAARRYHRAVEVGSMLIVTGGMNSNTVADHYQDAIVADVSSDGSVSAWRIAGQLPAARHGHIASAANGFLYFGQGCQSFDAITNCTSAAVNDIWVTAVGSDGGLGNWVKTQALEDERAGATSHVIKGRLYSFGGCDTNCDTNVNNVSNTGRQAGLGSVPRMGSFSKVYDFDTSATPTKFITRGTKQDGALVSVTYSNNFTCNNTAYDNTKILADVGYTGANVQSIILGRTQARCFILRYTIDDTSSSKFPDTGNETTVTDFDLYFKANPGQRLRGGRTFTNGADRGLDAQPQ